jgi:5'-3' exonuclease
MAKKTAADKEKPILLVDVSNLVYRQAFKLRFLKRGDGRPTGGVFGTVRSLLSWAKDFRVIAVFDGSPIDRMLLLDSYKSGRTDTVIDAAPQGQVPSIHVGETLQPVPFDQREEALEAEPLPENTTTLKTLVREDLAYLMNYLPGFGIPVMCHPQQEADDMIGYTVLLHQLTGTELPIYVLSADKDFDQLPAAKITPSKIKLQEGKPSPKVILKDHFLLEDSFFYFPEVPQDSMLRQYPHFLLLYRALVGDSSDKITRVLTKRQLWKKDPVKGYLFDQLATLMQQTLMQQQLPVTQAPAEWQSKLSTESFCGFQLLLQRYLDSVESSISWECFNALLDETQLAGVRLNIRLTRIPFNVVKAAQETRINLIPAPGAGQKSCLVETFWQGHMDSYTDPALVHELCMNFEMSSLVKGFDTPTVAMTGWQSNTALEKQV